MRQIELTVENVGRDFNRRPVFRGITFVVKSSGSLAVTGLNGAGKSTLVKILAGVIMPSKGSVKYSQDGRELSHEEVRPLIGLVSPYLNLYDEFTAAENLGLLSRIRSGNDPDAGEVERRLRQVSLWNRRDDIVGTFSSGMKQRLKYAFALLHRPSILFLDEPTSNLDVEGITVVEQIVAEQKERGILIVATNDAEEASWCADHVHLEGSGKGNR